MRRKWMVVKVECEVMEVVHDSDAAVQCRIEPASVALKFKIDSGRATAY